MSGVGVEQTGAPEVQHDLGNTAGKKDFHCRMIARAVRQRVHDSRNLAADPRPIVRDRPAQAGGVGDRGHVQDQVGRSAERRMRHHRVLRSRHR